jgi:hypothetical protein
MTAFVIKYVKSGPGYSFTDNQAIFMARGAAEAYIRRCRLADPDSDVEPDETGWIDTNWYMEELPLGPEALPVKEGVLKRWKVLA